MTKPYASLQREVGHEDAFPNISVTVRDINFNDVGGQADWEEQPDGSCWADYEIHNKYFKDGHIFMMPLTSPYGFQGATVGFCQLASPTLLLVVDWTASRWVEKPKVPSTTLNDKGWVLMDIGAETVDVMEGPDGTSKLYRISGTYTYGHLAPNADVFKNLTWPKAPWLGDIGDRLAPTTLQETSVIDQAGATAPGNIGGFITRGMGQP